MIFFKSCKKDLNVFLLIQFTLLRHTHEHKQLNNQMCVKNTSRSK